MKKILILLFLGMILTAGIIQSDMVKVNARCATPDCDFGN